MNVFNRKISFQVTLIFCTGILINIARTEDSWKLYNDIQVGVVEITVDPGDLQWMYDNVESDSLHPATVHYTNLWIDETVDSVGFGLRGNTSRSSDKKSFKLSFNTFVPGRQFYDVDKLNLNGEHNDPSIIRSKLCWDLFRKIGMTASRAAHVAVYINGQYYGLYISVEHVDDKFLQKNFANDNGNLWKCLYPADLDYLGDDPDLYKYYTSWGRQPYNLKTNEAEDDYSQLARLIDIINNTPDEQFADSLETVLSVPEVLRYFAINVLVGGWDDYWFLKNNYYLYHDPADGLFHWIPYDYDNTFGIDWFTVEWSTIDPYEFANFEETQGQTPEPRPLTERIMANAQYRNLYSHFLQFYNDQVYNLALWEPRLESLKAMITSWAAADIYRTMDYDFTMDDFNDSYGTAYSNQHVERGIREFVNLRNNSLDSQISWLVADPIVYDIDWWPKVPQATDSIYVTVSAFSNAGLEEVVIQYHPGVLTVIWSYPMVFSPEVQTNYVEDTDRWVGVIPPLGVNGSGHFQIFITDVNQQSQVYPRTQLIPIRAPGMDTTQIVINEFLAKNDAFNTDQDGEYDDWLELYNPTDTDVFLSGMYLTDRPDVLTKWQIHSGGVAIAAHDYLIFWCDEDQEQSGLHTNFKLSANGEFLALVAADGITIIDSITFGIQTPDIAYGRYPDAEEDWDFLAPTPGSTNISLAILSVGQPSAYQLSVYPNPFNAGVNFQYYISQPGELQISIYDLLGRKVWSATETIPGPGVYSSYWDSRTDRGTQLSSGIYICRIGTRDWVESQKIMLLK